MRSIAVILIFGIALCLILLSGPWFVGYPVWASVPLSFVLGCFVGKGAAGFMEDVSNG